MDLTLELYICTCRHVVSKGDNYHIQREGGGWLGSDFFFFPPSGSLGLSASALLEISLVSFSLSDLPALMHTALVSFSFY